MNYVYEELKEMITPEYNGRPMKQIGKFNNNVLLFIDEKTGIKQCFSIWDLTHKEFTGRLYSLPDENGNVGHKKLRGARIGSRKRKSCNDNRLSDLIDYFEGAYL